MTSFDEYLQERDLRALRQARLDSTGLQRSAGDLLCDFTTRANPTAHITWAALGSVARREWTAASDLDVILLTTDPIDASLREFDRDAREMLRSELEMSVSKGEDLTSVTRVQEFSNQGAIGGTGDSSQLLTKRALLMTESVTLYAPNDGRDLRQEARRTILAAFGKHPVTRGDEWHSLINDIARYYRQFLIEYKYKIDNDDRPWALRNAKLRHTRKLWFFSTAVALVRLGVSRADKGAPSENDVLSALDSPPWDRLDTALSIAGTSRPDDAIKLFDGFIAEVGQSGVRTTLEALKYDDREKCSEHQRLKHNSKEFHNALLAVVDRLPSDWRRALLSHFFF